MATPTASKPIKPSETGENTLIKVYPTRLIYFKGYLLGSFLIILWLVLWFELFSDVLFLNQISKFINPFKDYFFAFLGAGLIIIVFMEIALRRNIYRMTNFRIIHDKGILGTSESSIEYEMISHHTLRQTQLQKMLNIGSIDLHLVAGGKESIFHLENIPKINKIKEILNNKLFSSSRTRAV